LSTEGDTNVYQQLDPRTNKYIEFLNYNNRKNFMNNYSMGNEIDFLRHRIGQAEEKALIQSQLDMQAKIAYEEQKVQDKIKEKYLSKSPPQKKTKTKKKPKPKPEIQNKNNNSDEKPFSNLSILEDSSQNKNISIEPENFKDIKEKIKEEIQEIKAFEIKGVLKHQGIITKKSIRAKKKISVLCWFMVYPTLLKKQIIKIINNKKQKVDFNASKDVKQQVNIFSNYMKKHCFTSFRNLYERFQSLNIIPVTKNGKTKPFDKFTIQKRSKLISVILSLSFF